VSSKKKKKAPKPPVRPALGIGENLEERIILAAIIVLPFLLYFKYVFGGAFLYGSDWVISGYTSREFIARYLASHGRLPLWNPFVFGGVPTVAAFLGDIFYPTTLFRIFIPVKVVWAWTFASHMALAGIATYYFCKDLGLDRRASVVGAVAYMFCGSIVSMTNPGHDGKMICAALLPVAFLFFNRAVNTGKLYYFIFAGSAVGFSFLAGHVQMTYYMALALFLFLLFRLFGMWANAGERGRIGRVTVYSLVTVLFGLCLISVQYLPVFKYLAFAARGSERGYGWATSWSLPTSELLDLVTPHFSGIGERYWGTNYFKLDSQYLGILPLLLAPLALLGKRTRNVKFFIGLLVLGLVLALGGHTPLYKLAYYVIPGVKKFRGPSMIFYIASFSIAVLSAFGAARLMEDLKEQQKRRVLTYLLAASGALLLFSVICAGGQQSIIDFLSNRIKPYLTANYTPSVVAQKVANVKANYTYFLKGLTWSLVLLMANAALVWALAAKKVAKNAWAVSVCLLLVVDLWVADRSFIHAVRNPSEYFGQDEVVSFLKSQPGPYRVFPYRYEHTNDNFLMHHGIESIAGYHGNQLQSYQDFIGAGSSVMFAAANLDNQKLLDMLNAKYIVSFALPEDLSRFDERTKSVIEEIRAFVNRVNFKQVLAGRNYTIYENTSALDRATLVPGCEVLPRDKVMERLKQDSFEPRNTVVLEEDPQTPLPGGAGPAGTVEIAEYGPNRVVMKADCREGCMLLLADDFYDQWRARVDGKRVKIFRADYTFRAVVLSAGPHTIDMEYDSPAMRLGALFSILAFAGLVFCVFIWRSDLRRSGAAGGGKAG
jgi:hypothetical protein